MINSCTHTPLIDLTSACFKPSLHVTSIIGLYYMYAHARAHTHTHTPIKRPRDNNNNNDNDIHDNDFDYENNDDVDVDYENNKEIREEHEDIIKESKIEDIKRRGKWYKSLCSLIPYKYGPYKRFEDPIQLSKKYIRARHPHPHTRAGTHTQLSNNINNRIIHTHTFL